MTNLGLTSLAPTARPHDGRKRALRACVAVAMASLACACGGQLTRVDTFDAADPAAGSDGPGTETGSGTTPGTGGDAGTGPHSNGDAAVTPSGAQLSGSGRFIALFPIAEGAIVVASDGVRRIGRDGSVAASWTTAREITAAAFDGTLLGIADKAVVTTLDRKFATVAKVQLTESCASALIASGERFVCTPTNDWDNIKYVFDLRAGRLLNTSAPVTYEGTRLKAIPGTDDFVSVTYGSPGHFALHRMNARSSVDYLGESPDHGLFPVTETYTVVGNPGTHVLTQTGLLLKIYPDGASADSGSAAAPFTKDGALGTLLGDSQSFIALDANADDAYGLVATQTYENRLCASGCWLQHVNVASRTVVSTRVHRFDGSALLDFHHDLFASKAWVTVSPPGTDPWSTTGGYVVQLLDY